MANIKRIDGKTGVIRYRLNYISYYVYQAKERSQQ